MIFLPRSPFRDLGFLLHLFILSIRHMTFVATSILLLPSATVTICWGLIACLIHFFTGSHPCGVQFGFGAVYAIQIFGFMSGFEFVYRGLYNRFLIGGYFVAIFL